MSVLSELFKTIGETLHMPVLTKPLWEEMIREVDALEVRVATLEKSISTSPLSLDPAMVAEMKDSWHKEKARRVQYELDAHLKADQQAAEIALETKPAESETKPAEGETAAADPDLADGAAAAEQVSGTAGDTAASSPSAQPDLAAAGDKS